MTALPAANPLRDSPAFRSLWIARTVSHVGDGIALLALVLLVQRTRGTGVAVGTLLLASSLPRFLGPLAGVVVDRVEQRRLMILCDLGQVILFSSIAWFAPPFPVLLALVALSGMLDTLFAPAGRSAVPALVRPEQLLRANAWIGTSLNLQVALGPVLGGILVDLFDVRGALVVNAATFLVSALVLLRLPPLRASSLGEPGGFLAVGAEGLRFAWRTPAIRTLVMALFLGVAFAAVDNVALVFLVRETLGAGPVAFGIVGGAYGIGMLAGSIGLSWKGTTVGVGALLILGWVASGVGTILTGIAPIVVFAMLGQAVAGLGNGIENVAADTLIQEAVPREMLGRARDHGTVRREHPRLRGGRLPAGSHLAEGRVRDRGGRRPRRPRAAHGGPPPGCTPRRDPVRPHVASCRAVVGERTAGVSAAALAPFSEAFQGEIVLPGSAGYDAARMVWNATIDRRPAIVARCDGVDDVIRCIRFARDQDLAIAVRSGGHSVGGFSTCDDGIVIDLSLMRGVRVDPERRIASVRGGSLLSQLDEGAQEHGLACPVGVVGHTGVAGLTLGGGMGRLQRRWGFSIDNMAAVELVTADGLQLRVSDEEHPDLFWGIRGAGPNFGIVTGFEFRLHELGPTITQGMLAFPGERAHEVAERVREYAPSAPDEVMFSYVLGVGPTDPEFPPEIAGRPFVSMVVTHCGDVDAADEAIRPLRDLRPSVDTIEPRRYLDVQRSADEDMAWGKRFYMKGGFLAELSDAYVDAGLATIPDAPGPECMITLWLQGGAIARVPEDTMAFTGRRAPFWLGVEAAWDDPSLDEAHRNWGRATMDALAPFTAEGKYVNDVVESGDDVARSIYGDAKYDRLVGLKRAFDPDNVFRLNQNIRP